MSEEKLRKIKARLRRKVLFVFVFGSIITTITVLSTLSSLNSTQETSARYVFTANGQTSFKSTPFYFDVKCGNTACADQTIQSSGSVSVSVNNFMNSNYNEGTTTYTVSISDGNGVHDAYDFSIGGVSAGNTDSVTRTITGGSAATDTLVLTFQKTDLTSTNNTVTVKIESAGAYEGVSFEFNVEVEQMVTVTFDPCNSISGCSATVSPTTTTVEQGNIYGSGTGLNGSLPTPSWDNHHVFLGWFEDGYSFDYEFYYDNNPDFARSGLTRTYEHMVQHWIEYGYNEGRYMPGIVRNNTTMTKTQDHTLHAEWYSKAKQVIINTVPAGASITASTNNDSQVHTGQSQITFTAYTGDTVVYSASKSQYTPQSGTRLLTYVDGDTVTITITLLRTISVTSTADTDDQTIVCKDGSNQTILSSSSGRSVSASNIQIAENSSLSLDCEVLADGYYDKTETVTFADNNLDVQISPSAAPSIAGTYTNTVNTSATTGSLTNYTSGYYLVEMWGGKGGHGGNGMSGYTGGSGGGEGYVYGVIQLNRKADLGYSLGGNGTDVAEWTFVGEPYNKGVAGGANGGGSTPDASTDCGAGGAGGGYSALSSGASFSTSSLLMLAGGGGGGSGRGGRLGAYSGSNGGNGGNMSNSTVRSLYGGTIFAGSNGIARSGKYYGLGGNGADGNTVVTAGYCPGNSNGTYGGQFYGGASKKSGGGGGAGYYGGGGGSKQSDASTGGVGGGGGGSSYVASSVRYTNLPSSATGLLVGTNPSSTGGAMIITYIGKTL